jgi:hypothetical protein
MRCFALLVLATLLGFGVSPPLAGQARWTGAADATVASRYYWRGITRRNDWVLQADLVTGARFSGSFLTVGGWTNFEFSVADPASTDIGLGQHFGQWDLWAEFATWAGPFDLSLGYTRYFFDEAAAAAVGSTVFNTGEFYANGQVRIGGFTPRVAVWLDLEEVKGAYFELSATYRIPVLPLAVPSLYLGALAGVSAGQAVNTADPEEGGYFAEDGVTHVDIFARTQVYAPIGPVRDLYITPDVHLLINVDEATKRTSRALEDQDRGTKWLLFNIALSWFW